MFWYCQTCDDFYIYRKHCPVCGGEIKPYKRKEDAPIGLRCKDCSIIGTVKCGVTRFSLTAPFYSKPCKNFVSKISK